MTCPTPCMAARRPTCRVRNAFCWQSRRRFTSRARLPTTGRRGRIMAREFKLPDIGEGISEVELLQWYVQEGDTVREDQNLAEIETDKAVADLPSPYTGVVSRLHFKPGE